MPKFTTMEVINSEAFKLDLKIRLDVDHIIISDGLHFRTYSLLSTYKNRKWFVEIPVPLQLINDPEFDLIEYLRKGKNTAFEALIKTKNGKTTR